MQRSSDAAAGGHTVAVIEELRASSPSSQSSEASNDQEQTTAVVVVAPVKKTNSDRSKEFRAKRKKHEDALAGVVDALRREVDDLRFLRGVRQEKLLKSRHSASGSLARLVQEYFAFFHCGMPNAVSGGRKRGALGYEDPGELETRQLAFLRSAMHPDLRFGEVNGGVEALVDQWKRYTSYHASLRVEVKSIEVVGPEDSPIVIVTSHLHVRLSRDTFKNVFPHVADNEELVQRFIGKDVTYKGVNHYQFSEDGRILVYDSDVGFVDAFHQAGASFEDIALLMNQALIAHHAILGEDDASLCTDSCGSPGTDSEDGRTDERALRPRRVFEILSEEDEEDRRDGNQELEIYEDKAESYFVEEPEAAEYEGENEEESSKRPTTGRLDIRFLLS